MNAVVNAQRDGVVAGAQALFKQEPILALWREASVKATGPCHDQEFGP